MMKFLDRYFAIAENGSTVRTEILGGLTTFATMCYIVFVQPTVLQAAGMPFGGVLIGTCVAAAFGSILMGLLARYPIALAPGMGQNFLFAFTICGPAEYGGMGFSWQAGLAIVFIAGLLFVALAAFRTREKILAVMPDCLKHALGPAIGLFIAYVGLQWGGLIVKNEATMTHLGDFGSGPASITLAALAIMAALHARGLHGGILLGILFAGGVGLATGVLPFREPDFALRADTAFQLSFGALWTHWDKAVVAILLFFFLDLFDTVGTLVGVSSQGGFLKEDGTLPRAGRAFMADAVGSCFGALAGTSAVTSYVESAAGIGTGARTGLAAVVTGLCFLAAILLAPAIYFVGADIGPAFYGVAPGSLHVAMYPAVAPALIFVGFLMMAPLRRIAWDDVTESLPAFFTLIFMVLGFGITEGVATGCIAYAAVKLLAGRRREVHPVMYAVAAALTARYIFLV